MSIVDTFFGTGNDIDPGALPAAWSDELMSWMARWSDPTNGGPAPLPRRVDGRVFWYVLMEDMPQRRELEQLLQYWLGPACTDVASRRGALDVQDPFDARLEAELPGRVARIEVLPLRSDDPAGHKQNLEVVRARLKRLVTLLEQRPGRRPTQGCRLGAVLDEAYLLASQGDLAAAMVRVAELEDRRLLDAPNNAFVRVRVTALASGPEELLASRELRDLAGLVVPPRLAALVADAYLQVVEAWEDIPTVGGHVLEIVRQAAPAFDEESLERLVSLGVVEAPVDAGSAPPEPTAVFEPGPPGTDVATDEPATDTEPAADASSAVDAGAPAVDAGIGGGLAYNLATQGKHAELLALAQSAEQIEPADLYLVLLSAEKLDDDDAARAGLALAERHTSVDTRWGLFDAQGLIDGLWGRLEGISTWDAWADAIASSKQVPEDVFDDAAEWAPMTGARLEQVLSEASVDDVSACIGSLLSAHRPRLDAAARGRVAVRLLEILAFAGRTGPSSRAATSILLEDAIDAGLPASVRSEVIGSVGLLLTEYLSAAEVDWGLDILAELIDWAGGSDTEALQQLINELLGKFRRLTHVMGRAGWETLQGLAAQLDVDLPPDVLADLEIADDENPFAKYSGKKILIYSLREPPARQAAARIRVACDAKVTLAHDKAGNTQFRGQIEGADVIVMVTGAAKHAATGFIEDHARGHLIKLHQTGMSAIVNALRSRA